MKVQKVKLEPLVLRGKLALLVKWVPWDHWVPEECPEKEGDLGHKELLDSEVHMACLANLDRWALSVYPGLPAFQGILE